MTIQFEAWHLVALGVLILLAFYGMTRLLMVQAGQAINDKFNQIAATLRAQDENGRRLERELLDLKAELPRNYVRREDYWPAIASIHTKLDAVRLELDQKFVDLLKRVGIAVPPAPPPGDTNVSTQVNVPPAPPREYGRGI